MDGRDVLGESITDLILKGPAHPIVYDELGGDRSERMVWTNVEASDDEGNDCGQWTSIEGSARVGYTGFMPDEGSEAQTWHEERQWIDLGVDVVCKNPYLRLYCVQATD